MELADFLQGWTNELQSSMKLNKVTNDSGGLDHPDLNTGCVSTNVIQAGGLNHSDPNTGCTNVCLDWYLRICIDF